MVINRSVFFYLNTQKNLYTDFFRKFLVFYILLHTELNIKKNIFSRQILKIFTFCVKLSDSIFFLPPTPTQIYLV